jgi:hypothetical protein
MAQVHDPKNGHGYDVDLKKKSAFFAEVNLILQSFISAI